MEKTDTVAGVVVVVAELLPSLNGVFLGGIGSKPNRAGWLTKQKEAETKGRREVGCDLGWEVTTQVSQIYVSNFPPWWCAF